jgi:hypothetical protein
LSVEENEVITMKVLESLGERLKQVSEYNQLIQFDDKIKTGWTIDDLINAEREIKEACVEPNDLPELTFKTDNLVGAEYVQNIIREAYNQMVAGFAFASTFLIPTDDNENTNHVNLNNSIGYILRTSTIAMEYLYYTLTQHNYFMKLMIHTRLINIETTEIIDFLVVFPPECTWAVNSHQEIEKFKKQLGSLFDSLVDGSKYPSTKYRLHSIRSFVTKFALQSWAGCGTYIHKNNNDFKKVKCVINPSDQDDMCFWRCLVIGLRQNYGNNEVMKNEYNKIKAQALRNAFQRTEAIKLRNLYYSSKEEYLGYTEADFKANPPPNRIVLNLDGKCENNIIRDICNVLSGKLERNMSISIHTIQEMTLKGKPVRAETTLLSERNDSNEADIIDDKDVIHLHYDLEKSHFLLITKFRSYGEVMKCPSCDKVYPYNHPEDLEKHKQGHIKTKNITNDKEARKKVFKMNKRITYKKSFTEKFLNIETFIRPFYLAFDIEAMLKNVELNSTTNTSNRNVTKKHEPIMYVLKGHSAQDFA